MKPQIENIQEYWHVFDLLLESLKNNESLDIALKLKDAQKHINGLTDGWYEFIAIFEELLLLYSDRLTISQKEMIQELTLVNKQIINKQVVSGR